MGFSRFTAAPGSWRRFSFAICLAALGAPGWSAPWSWSDSDIRIGIASPLTDCEGSRNCLLVQAKPPLLYLQWLSERALVVGYAAAPEGAEPQPVLLVDSIRCHEGPGGSSPEILDTGISRAGIGFTRQHALLTEVRQYLLLDRPLSITDKCRLIGTDPTFSIALSLRFSEEAISPSVQADHVGYLPQAGKSARVGNWLGTLGPLPVDALTFHLVDAHSAEVRFSGPLAGAEAPDPWSGNRVLEADFSAVTQSGVYQVSVPGIGRSPSFRIGIDIHEAVFRSVFRVLYHARNSTRIEAPWAAAGFERPGGIPDRWGARIHPAVPTSPLGSGEAPLSRRDVQRGWFDAGDYGQYVTNAAPVWYAFALGIDLGAPLLSADDLGIPESANGLPDALDELEWGMDWLLAMQDSEDGGVYSRLAPMRWDAGLPHEVTQSRYLFEKTTHATASFAAVTALHARLIRPWRPDRAERVLDAARAAWKFLEKSPQWPAEGDVYRNPPGVSAGEYPDRSATDNRLWAAAELYRTTGEQLFVAAFVELNQGFSPDATAPVSFQSQALAAYWALWSALPRAEDNPCHENDLIPASMCFAIERTLLAGGDWPMRKAAENAWFAPVHQHMKFLGWGTFGQSARAILPAFVAWKVSGDDAYRMRAPQFLHSQLGRNPLGISFITGTGDRSPRYPLSKLTEYGRSDHPLPGLPVNGPQYHLPALWDAMRTVNQAWWPPGDADRSPDGVFYPPLRRYVDSDLLPPMSEPTIAEVAAVAAAIALSAGSD